MSQVGPGPGVRSQVAALRQRALALNLGEGYGAIRATPDVVARLASAHALCSLGRTEVTLNLGDGAKAYSAGDIEQLLALCAEAFERYDTAES